MASTAQETLPAYEAADSSSATTNQADAIGSQLPSYKEISRRIFPDRFAVFHNVRFLRSAITFLGVDERSPSNHIEFGYGIGDAIAGRPSIELRSGPDKASPVLASCERHRWAGTFDIAIHGAERIGTESSAEVLRRHSTFIGPSSWSFKMTVSSEDAETGANPRTFVWRYGKTDEVRDIGLRRRGWVLVCLDQLVEDSSNIKDMTGEIVAVWAVDERHKKHRAFSFWFLGSALKGAFGGRWEVLTVATALSLWYVEVTDD